MFQQLDDRVSIEKDWFSGYKFHLVTSVPQLSKLVDICIQRRLYSIDCETTGVDNRIYTDDYFGDGKKTKYGKRTVDRIVGLCISFDGSNGYYVPLSHEPPDSGNLPWDETWNEIERLVHSGAKAIMHNAKFDAEFLYPLTNKEYWKLTEYEDTFLLANVINPLKSFPAGLKPLTKIIFNIDMIELDDLFTEEQRDQLKKEGRGVDFSILHPKEGLAYGCSDGIFTYKLWFNLSARLQESEGPIYNLEKSFCNIIRKMERNRVHIDVNRVNQLHEECKGALSETGDVIRSLIESKTGRTGKWLTLNVGSAKQLSQIIFTDLEGLKLKPIVNESYDGYASDSDSDSDSDSESEVQYSTKDEALKELDRVYGEKFTTIYKEQKTNLFQLILEYRHYEKMKGSYIEKFTISYDKNGDVRPSFNQMGTDTTRLSSKAGKIVDGYSGVAFQGIPRDSDDDKPELFKQIRTCIIPRPGRFLVKLDYSGEELRVVTNLSGDKVWTKSFLYEDGDVHSITSKILFNKNEISKDERNRGKRSNFAFIYGGGAGAIQRNVGCSIEDAQRHMENLRRGVPELMGYVEHQKRFAHKHKCIYTAFGRRIPIPTIDSPIKAIRKKAERCAINYTIQATSADILKFALCFVDKQIRAMNWEDKVTYVLTVHDEVVFEIVPELLMEAIPKLDEWMTYPWKLPKAHGIEWIVPLETEPGVDIHWRARYDFFAMTRGSKPNKKDINENGEFIGKLKKNQYFYNGKIYQEIPDFLAKYIKGPKDQITERIEKVEVKEESSQSQIEKVEVKEESSQIEKVEVKEESSQIEESSQELEIELEIQNKLVEETISQFEQDLPIPEPKFESKSMKSRPVLDGEKVYRWTILAILNENVAKKLHAVCILTEGEVPLRVVNEKGDIIISENNGIRVDPVRFQFLSDLFGLG